MKQTIIENGIIYKLGEDGLYYPQFEISSDVAHYGKYGMLRRTYLKEHRRALYSSLLMSGKLIEHLNEVDDQCREILDRLIPQMSEREGVTEALKAADQMEWVRQMSNIKNRAEEFIYANYVYEN
ncbi:MAG: TnpV protein [bacterium]|nr:TnpV protein [bacterium]